MRRGGRFFFFWFFFFNFRAFSQTCGGSARGSPGSSSLLPPLPSVDRSSGRDVLNGGGGGASWGCPLLFCRKRGLVLSISACHFNRGCVSAEPEA